MKPNGGPAFPEPGLTGLPNGEFIHGRAGMTLRDYFAAEALNGLIAEPPWGEGATAIVSRIGGAVIDEASAYASAAYALADAMIEAREE